MNNSGIKALRLRTLRLGSQVLRVAEAGPVDADETLLLFNGIGAPIEAAASFMQAFPSIRTITFDAPGVGSSPAPLLPYRFSTLADLSAHLLNELDIKRAHVFGVSWGGGLAQTFAYRHKARTRSLVLAATSTGIVAVPGDPRVLLELARPRRYSDPEHMMKVGPKLYGGLVQESTPFLRQHVDSLSGANARGYLYQLMAASGWTSWHWLPRIEAPALVMMGADDPILPPVNGRILTSRLRDARLEIIGCGHLFMMTLREDVAALMMSFFNDIRQKPAENSSCDPNPTKPSAEPG
ncbi:alpha/beta fold hydrolase [Leisingera sp. NJS204]|uniref:alpha/beta fold hydrolase n=1 Tax=Leisingera sp. NJS204 TaxID=2508307 RepID=UPI0010128C22|nr:alpha/beta fold hydrolase [Leisingera sp. NJS204]QAX30757.1 alpha/beta fold hydrolase [Leisingera sp. NJS204]